MESLSHCPGKKISRFFFFFETAIWDLENQELSMQLYFVLVLVMPRESVGLIVKSVKQSEGAVVWRQILGEYVSTVRKRSRHVVQVERSSVPSGI